MKSIKNIIIIIIIITAMVTISAPSVPATRTVGIGPVVVDFPDVYRFGEYQRTIFIYNGNDYESNFTLIVSGEIEEWVTFYETLESETPITSKIVPPETTMSIIMHITIPKSASNGAYTSNIYSEFVPTEELDENTTVAGVILRVPIVVNIYVSGTQNLNATISRVKFLDTEINYLLPILIDIKNTGNVVARPYANITIKKDRLFVDQFTGEMLSIQPDQIKYNTINWDTTGNIPGSYHANVMISLGERILKNDTYPFELFAPGTLTRNGSLTSLSISGEATKNGLIKIESLFANTGEIETRAKFIGEIYRDGKLVYTIESEEILVSRYSDKVLTSYYRFGSESGTYTIQGYVLYEGKETNIQTVSLQVGIVSFTVILTYIAITGLIIAMLLVYAILIMKKKKSGVKSRVKTMKEKTRFITKTGKKPILSSSSSKLIKNQRKPKLKPKKTKSANLTIDDSSIQDVEQFLDSIETPSFKKSTVKKKG